MSWYKHASRLARYTYVTLLVLKVLSNQNKHAKQLMKPYKHATCLKYDVSHKPKIKTGMLHLRAEFKY